jgi:hypothetical protein
LRETPDGEFVADAGGYWGEFAAEPDAYYEFVCLDPWGAWPPLHYYREPFPRSNNRVYFRVYPPPDSLLGWLFGLLPTDDAVASFSWANVNRAVLTGRDTLTVDGIDLATPAVADPAFTTLNILFGDFNLNGVSDLTALSLLPSRFYIKLFDLRVPTAPRRPVVFTFDGRTLATPNWRPGSEGISTVVFE